MSWGSTTTQQQNTSQSGNSASVPVQQDWVAALQKSLGGSAGSLVQQAGMPVFGSAQQSNFLNGLNQSTTTGQNALASGLASRGALNSGALASGLTNLQMNRQNQISQYNTNTPLMNQQAQFANLSKALSTAGAISSLAPTGQLNSSSSQGSSDSSTTSNPGFGSMLGGLLGFGLSALTGAGGMGGLLGGGIGAGSGEAPSAPSFNSIYDSGAFGMGPGQGPTPWSGPPAWGSTQPAQ